MEKDKKPSWKVIYELFGEAFEAMERENEINKSLVVNLIDRNNVLEMQLRESELRNKTLLLEADVSRNA